MSKKVAKVNKSDVVIEVTPDTSIEDLDWDTQWDVVQQSIRDVKIEGLRWAKDFALQDFVFGMKKLLVVCQIIDSKVESTAPVVERLLQIRGVGGAEMLTIETAGADWDQNELDEKNAKKKQGKKEKAAPAEGAAGEAAAPSKKAAKKAAKKEDEKEEERVIDEDMMKKDADKAALQCKESAVFVTGCNLSDGSGASDLTREQLTAIMTMVHEKAPDTVLMLTSAGKTRVSALIVVPAAKKGTLKAVDWLASTQLVPVGANGDDEAYGEYPCAAEKDEFPIKVKDVVNTQAFGFLKTAGLIQEESDDEVYGDDEEAAGGDY
jgi:translation elongation factor EF-1beta